MFERLSRFEGTGFPLGLGKNPKPPEMIKA
jgi:hypothetical protein